MSDHGRTDDHAAEIDVYHQQLQEVAPIEMAVHNAIAARHAVILCEQYPTGSQPARDVIAPGQLLAARLFSATSALASAGQPA